MKRDQLLERLMGIFLEELEEYLDSWREALAALEREPTDEGRAAALNTLFRVAHSLKGAARSVELTPIEEACHELESLLAHVRAGEHEVDAALLARLRHSGDALARAGRALREREQITADIFAPRTARPQVEPESPRLSPEAPPAVRISGATLDTLFARSSELLIAFDACTRLAAEARALRASAHAQHRAWRALHPSLVRADADGTEAIVRLPRRRLATLQGARDWLAGLEAALDRLTQGISSSLDQVGQQLSALELELRELRLQPFVVACAGLDRVVADLARESGREVRLELEGHEVAVDRAVVEALRDPLLQLVRNAVAHGIESPQERTAAGKPAQGLIRITARMQGSQLEVVLQDDGRGIDRASLADALRRSGQPVPSDDDALLAQVFEPGVSTASQVTRLAGRGVGLDIVRRRLESAHATVSVSSEPGRGTRFLILTPLTLSMLEVLFVQDSGRPFAVPLARLDRAYEVAPGQLRRVAGQLVVNVGETLMPAVPLGEILGLPPGGAPTAFVVLREPGRDRTVAALVERLIDQRQVIALPLGPRLIEVRHIAAATILADGSLVPIVRVGDILRSALRAGRHVQTAGAALGATDAPPRVAPRLLVADDSLTTRSMMRAILEDAGYHVTIAVDGADAWRRLTSEPQERFDLVVSDVEMPQVDGLELVHRIRATPRLAQLPVILVTGLASDAQRRAGLDAGATAYVVKSSFDQSHLLELIEQNL